MNGGNVWHTSRAILFIILFMGQVSTQSVALRFDKEHTMLSELSTDPMFEELQWSIELWW